MRARQCASLTLILSCFFFLCQMGTSLISYLGPPSFLFVHYLSKEDASLPDIWLYTLQADIVYILCVCRCEQQAINGRHNFKCLFRVQC